MSLLHRSALGIALVTASLSVFAPSVGRADAIGPPRADCVEGSEGDSCHGGGYCRARGCLGASDCRIGERCAARDLCTLTFDCFWDTVPAVSGACAAGCAAGSTCTNLFVCVPASPGIDAGRIDAGEAADTGALDTGSRADASTPIDDGGADPRVHSSYCGCTVPTRTPAPTWLGGAAIALIFAAVARRGRRAGSTL